MENTKEIKSFIRDLAKILKDSELGEVRVEQGETKIRVSRTMEVVAAPVAAAPAPVAAPAPAPALAAPAAAAATEEPAPASANAVLSPMVGTAYTSPDPDSPVFVKVGDSVTEGQTILIIEAMKVMNQIPAPRAGTVTQILISDAQPVEYNEPLLIIE